MKRNELYDLILEILELENDDNVSEATLLDSLEFNSLATLGVISVMDAYANIVISGKDLVKCKTIGDILDLVPNSDEDRTWESV